MWISWPHDHGETLVQDTDIKALSRISAEDGKHTVKMTFRGDLITVTKEFTSGVECLQFYHELKQQLLQQGENNG